MRILITGCTGYIGRNLMRRLNDNPKYQFDCLARNIDKCQSHNCRIIKLENYTDIPKLFKHTKYDGVIHLASLYLTEHKVNDIERLIDSNITLGTFILESCKLHNVKWFVNVGTFWQHYNNEPYNPVNLYAATKQAFVDIIKYYDETSNTKFVSLKIPDTYGPNDPRNKIITRLIHAAESGEGFNASPGHQTLDLCYIDDIADALIATTDYISNQITKQKYLEFHLSSTKKMKLIEIASIIETVYNKSINVKWGALPYRDREILYPYEDGLKPPFWSPKINFKDGIELIKNYYL